MREATPADLTTLLQFEQDLIAAERPFNPTLRTGHPRYYDLPAMMKSAEVLLLVGLWDGEVVASGYARIEQAKPYVDHERYGYLGFMYVAPDHRGKGINAAIMRELKVWLQEQGVAELRLDVYYHNVAAIRAYEKVGFRPLMTEMRMRLGADDAAE